MMDKEGARRRGRVTTKGKGWEMANKVVSGVDKTWGQTSWGKHTGTQEQTIMTIN